MADEKPYNINIEAKAQLEEIQKLLSELRSINAEMSKINGQTFSAVSMSMSAAELSKTGKDLANAIIAQRNASNELNKSLDESKTSLNSANKNIKEFKNEVSGATTFIKGFYLDLGAMAARMAMCLPSAVTAAIQAFGQQEVALHKLSAAVRASGGNMLEVSRWIQFFIASVRLVGEIVASEQQYSKRQYIFLCPYCGPMKVNPKY